MLRCGECDVAETGGWCPIVREIRAEPSPCVVCRSGLLDWVRRQEHIEDERRRRIIEDERDLGADVYRPERRYNTGVIVRYLWPQLDPEQDQQCPSCGCPRLNAEHVVCGECGARYALETTRPSTLGRQQR